MAEEDNNTGSLITPTGDLYNSLFNRLVDYIGKANSQTVQTLLSEIKTTQTSVKESFESLSGPLEKISSIENRSTGDEIPDTFIDPTLDTTNIEAQQRYIDELGLKLKKIEETINNIPSEKEALSQQDTPNYSQQLVSLEERLLALQNFLPQIKKLQEEGLKKQEGLKTLLDQTKTETSDNAEGVKDFFKQFKPDTIPSEIEKQFNQFFPTQNQSNQPSLTPAITNILDTTNPGTPPNTTSINEIKTDFVFTDDTILNDEPANQLNIKTGEITEIPRATPVFKPEIQNQKYINDKPSQFQNNKQNNNENKIATPQNISEPNLPENDVINVANNTIQILQTKDAELLQNIDSQTVQLEELKLRKDLAGSDTYKTTRYNREIEQLKQNIQSSQEKRLELIKNTNQVKAYIDETKKMQAEVQDAKSLDMPSSDIKEFEKILQNKLNDLQNFLKEKELYNTESTSTEQKDPKKSNKDNEAQLSNIEPKTDTSITEVPQVQQPTSTENLNVQNNLSETKATTSPIKEPPITQSNDAINNDDPYRPYTQAEIDNIKPIPSSDLQITTDPDTLELKLIDQNGVEVARGPEAENYISNSTSTNITPTTNLDLNTIQPINLENNEQPLTTSVNKETAQSIPLTPNTTAINSSQINLEQPFKLENLNNTSAPFQITTDTNNGIIKDKPLDNNQEKNILNQQTTIETKSLSITPENKNVSIQNTPSSTISDNTAPSNKQTPDQQFTNLPETTTPKETKLKQFDLLQQIIPNEMLKEFKTSDANDMNAADLLKNLLASQNNNSVNLNETASDDLLNKFKITDNNSSSNILESINTNSELTTPEDLAQIDTGNDVLLQQILGNTEVTNAALQAIAKMLPALATGNTQNISQNMAMQQPSTGQIPIPQQANQTNTKTPSIPEAPSIRSRFLYA
jgi:hypothetical protein